VSEFQVPATADTSFVNGIRIADLSLDDLLFFNNVLTITEPSSNARARRRPIDQVRGDLLATLQQQALANDAMQELEGSFYFWVPQTIAAEDMPAFNDQRALVTTRIAALSAPLTGPTHDDDEDLDDDFIDVPTSLSRPAFAPIVLNVAPPRPQMPLSSAQTFAMPGASLIQDTSLAPLASVFLSGVPTSQNEVTNSSIYFILFYIPSHTHLFCYRRCNMAP
jgi:hypothetical protein